MSLAGGPYSAWAAVARPSPPPARVGPCRPRLIAENSRPGDPHWEIRHLGAPGAIGGYAGRASVLPGESCPLFASAASAGNDVYVAVVVDFGSGSSMSSISINTVPSVAV